MNEISSNEGDRFAHYTKRQQDIEDQIKVLLEKASLTESEAATLSSLKSEHKQINDWFIKTDKK